MAFSFGALEALTPALGYYVGMRLSSAADGLNHWLAFIILALLGALLIWRSLSAGRERAALVASPGLLAVLAIAIGTSADGAAVGVPLALLGANLPLALLTIGVVTFAVTFLGLRLGRAVGEFAGRKAELIGGLGFMAVGVHIVLKAAPN